MPINCLSSLEQLTVLNFSNNHNNYSWYSINIKNISDFPDEILIFRGFFKVNNVTNFIVEFYETINGVTNFANNILQPNTINNNNFYFDGWHGFNSYGPVITSMSYYEDFHYIGFNLYNGNDNGRNNDGYYGSIIFISDTNPEIYVKFDILKLNNPPI